MKKIVHHMILLGVLSVLLSMMCEYDYNTRRDEVYLGNKSREAIVIESYDYAGFTQQVKLVVDTIEPQDSVLLAYYSEYNSSSVKSDFPDNISASLSKIAFIKTMDGDVVNVDVWDRDRYQFWQKKDDRGHYHVLTLTITDADLVVADRE